MKGAETFEEENTMSGNYKMVGVMGIVSLLAAGLFCPAAFGGTISRFNMPAKKLYSLVLKYSEAVKVYKDLVSDDAELALYFQRDVTVKTETCHEESFFYFVTVIPDSETTSTLQVEASGVGCLGYEVQGEAVHLTALERHYAEEFISAVRGVHMRERHPAQKPSEQ
jgi:hypothetical protein